jgi:hypothetical protein
VSVVPLESIIYKINTFLRMGSVLDQNKIQEFMFLSEQAWFTLSRDIINHGITAGVTEIPMQMFLYITVKLALV